MFLRILMETKHEKLGARGDWRRCVTGVSGCGTVGAHPNALEFHCPDRCARVRGPICGPRGRSVCAALAGCVGARAAISRDPTDNLLIIRRAARFSARRVFFCAAPQAAKRPPRQQNADTYRPTGISTSLSAVAATDVPAAAPGYLPCYRIGEVDATKHAAIVAATGRTLIPAARPLRVDGTNPSVP